jgi:phage baseplate assembly protein W
MVGMNRETGKPLGGFEHVRQSIGDILTTPLLTRVFRRDYGGEGTYLVDKPALPETLLSFTIALGDAINKWEPRYRLHRVWFEEAGQDGRFIINMDGQYYPRGHLGDFETGVQIGVELPLPRGYSITGRV